MKLLFFRRLRTIIACELSDWRQQQQKKTSKNIENWHKQIMGKSVVTPVYIWNNDMCTRKDRLASNAHYMQRNSKCSEYNAATDTLTIFQKNTVAFERMHWCLSLSYIYIMQWIFHFVLIDILTGVGQRMDWLQFESGNDWSLQQYSTPFHWKWQWLLFRITSPAMIPYGVWPMISTTAQ